MSSDWIYFLPSLRVWWMCWCCISCVCMLQLTLAVCRSTGSSTVSPRTSWRCLVLAAVDRRHTQNAPGENCNPEQRCSGQWWAHCIWRTQFPAGYGSEADRGVDHPAPWNCRLRRASDSPGCESRKEQRRDEIQRWMDKLYLEGSYQGFCVFVEFLFIIDVLTL